jgi:hypothetical protein
VLSLLAGFVWLFLPPGDSSNGMAWRLVGIGYLVVGVVEIAVARGLLRGNPTARIVFTIAMVANLVLSVAGATTSGTSRGVSFLSILVVIVAIVILYTRKANAFFGRERVTSTR